VIFVERRRDLHDEAVNRALMTAILSRTKDPAAVAKRLYVRSASVRPRQQTNAEARAVVQLLAARFGWKKRPLSARVVD